MLRGLLVGVVVALVALLALPAGAVETDRLAVEILDEETPREALLAFERACYRTGAPIEDVQPVQLFDFHEGHFVRFRAAGSPLLLRCLQALEPGRRGVDGSIEWYDGFRGGLLVNAEEESEEGDRVPDEVWYDPEANLPVPQADSELLERLMRGDSEALGSLDEMALDEALAYVRALARDGSAGAAAALEQIARKHPHWRVRRAAAQALNPAVSLDTLLAVAKGDSDWEVRHGAVEQLGLVTAAAGGLGPANERAAQLLLDLLRTDPAWEVRRQAIWQMSTGLVEASRAELRQAAQQDASPQVRATALEALAGVGHVSREDARRALEDSAPAVRAVAASALGGQMTRADAPLLWHAMQAPERIVRLAAATLVQRIDDSTIGPQVWQLYVRESDEIDADPTYQQVLLEFLGRSPFPQLASLVAARLDGPLPPDERRLLSRLLAKIAPEEATRRLLPQLDSADASQRAIAADALPDSPSVRARRRALLTDADADVRAAAVIGLCRVPGAVKREELSRANLDPMGLGREAAIAAAHCGKQQPTPPRLRTTLGLGSDSGAATEVDRKRGVWPAVAGILLLLASVIGLRLSSGRGGARS